jgi:hypothetical protein
LIYYRQEIEKSGLRLSWEQANKVHVNGVQHSVYFFEVTMEWECFQLALFADTAFATHGAWYQVLEVFCTGMTEPGMPVRDDWT